MKSEPTLKSTTVYPKGQILAATHHPDGHATLVLDNGPARKITILCHSEKLAELIGAGGETLVEHITTRKPGHFRTKQSAA